MGMISRMSVIVKSRMILDSRIRGRRCDYSYEKQLEMLRGVKRGVVGSEAPSSNRHRSRKTFPSWMHPPVYSAGREDMLAGPPAQAAAVLEFEGLDEQISGMDVEGEAEGRAAESGQGGCVQRTKKEVAQGPHHCPGAVRIASALSGIRKRWRYWSGHPGAKQMRAKAGAIDELADEWVLGGLHRAAAMLISASSWRNCPVR